MATNWPQPGLNHVGEYQASGHVFVVTGSANTVFLKYVASSITAAASGGDSSVTFYDSSHTGGVFSLKNGDSARFTGKFLTFKVAANGSALVEMTNIPSASYLPPSGSQLFYHST